MNGRDLISLTLAVLALVSVAACTMIRIGTTEDDQKGLFFKQPEGANECTESLSSQQHSA